MQATSVKSVLPGEPTPAQRQEYITKGANLKSLVESPGWLVFKEIVDRAVLAESNVETIDLKGLSLTKIGEELKIQRKVIRRLRIVFSNMVELVEKGEHELRLHNLSKNPGGIFKKFDTPFGEGEDLLGE